MAGVRLAAALDAVQVDMEEELLIRLPALSSDQSLW